MWDSLVVYVECCRVPVCEERSELQPELLRWFAVTSVNAAGGHALRRETEDRATSITLHKLPQDLPCKQDPIFDDSVCDVLF
jgi:hypothetical protein